MDVVFCGKVSPNTLNLPRLKWESPSPWVFSTPLGSAKTWTRHLENDMARMGFAPCHHLEFLK